MVKLAQYAPLDHLKGFVRHVLFPIRAYFLEFIVMTLYSLTQLSSLLQ